MIVIPETDAERTRLAQCLAGLRRMIGASVPLSLAASDGSLVPAETVAELIGTAQVLALIEGGAS